MHSSASATQKLCDPSRGARPHRSAANSGGIFFHPQSHLDLVRPGISLYGIDPTCRPSIDRALRPVMRWTAPLIGIRDLAAGATVGYGQTWRTTKPTRLGLIPVGYADGYPRSLSNRGVMMVAGQPAPVAGRVSMDLTVIDLQNAPHAVVGEEVTVLDNDPLSPASVYRIAELAGTIPTKSSAESARGSAAWRWTTSRRAGARPQTVSGNPSGMLSECL